MTSRLPYQLQNRFKLPVPAGGGYYGLSLKSCSAWRNLDQDVVFMVTCETSWEQCYIIENVANSPRVHTLDALAMSLREDQTENRRAFICEQVKIGKDETIMR